MRPKVIAAKKTSYGYSLGVKNPEDGSTPVILKLNKTSNVH